MRRGRFKRKKNWSHDKRYFMTQAQMAQGKLFEAILNSKVKRGEMEHRSLFVCGCGCGIA